MSQNPSSNPLKLLFEKWYRKLYHPLVNLRTSGLKSEGSLVDENYIRMIRQLRDLQPSLYEEERMSGEQLTTGPFASIAADLSMFFDTAEKDETFSTHAELIEEMTIRVPT